jgi:membrane-bound metal-dependent hydrolase YbcI (DUF457 family)
VAGTVTYIIAKKVIAFNKTGHLIIGALISVVASRTYTDALFLLIGSILPDIDHRHSTLGRYNPFRRFMKHRGHAHSLIGGVLLSLPFLWFGERAFYFVLLGCVGHLLADKLHSWGKFKIRVW